ncbi:acylneuraminate cytidylyltransferase family protein [Polaribacter gochangensis]|uniref:acylneuraminate cytidylyltransferase family protein n=1 Tax=Polaribacter gochangensis TaxID=3252903 RepID=UPI003904DA2D
MIVASICMRGGSKGVKGKNYRDLLEKPLMSYTFECAKNAATIDDVIVSSDSDLILDISKKYLEEGKVFKRSNVLSSDEASKWEVFKDLVLKYEEKNNLKITYLVDLDVTVPRRLPEHIDACIQLAKESKVDVVITGYKPERNPYFNMMEEKEDGTFEIVKKSKKPIVCRQDAPIVYSLTPAVYVIKREALFQFDHWSNASCKIYPIPRELAIDIDTELDFKLVEFLMKKNGE